MSFRNYFGTENNISSQLTTQWLSLLKDKSKVAHR